VETKLVLSGLARPNHSARCDATLIKAIARGRAWFDELATGRAGSLQAVAKRDRITRRYVRCLVGLAFLSPRLIEAILQGRKPVELTTTRLTGLDPPLDWTEQHSLLLSWTAILPQSCSFATVRTCLCCRSSLRR
jgi:site-specific DNA recombinase